MITAGPDDLEVMTFGDWVMLLKYAETHTSLTPAVLRYLAIKPEAVRLEDLADELDDLYDTGPPYQVAEVIVGVLKTLADNGVSLAWREDAVPRKPRRRRATRAGRKRSKG